MIINLFLLSTNKIIYRALRKKANQNSDTQSLLITKCCDFYLLCKYIHITSVLWNENSATKNTQTSKQTNNMVDNGCVCGISALSAHLSLIYTSAITGFSPWQGSQWSAWMETDAWMCAHRWSGALYTVCLYSKFGWLDTTG